MSYGARAITAGGLMSLPKLVFPGGALVGDDAGFLNASRIKGSHAAIKTGMLAADAAFDAVQAGRTATNSRPTRRAFKTSWLHTELHRARNFKQWMSKGLYLGTLMVGIEQKLLGGNVPWTLHHQHSDHEMLKPASQCKPITYPKPDGKLTFDRLSSVFISNTNHEENQPAHLTLKDPSVPVNVNWQTYAGPEARYCPAAVYEFVKNDDDTERLRDQCAELRALQDLRYQGPDAEHRVGDAGRRRRSELSEYVSRLCFTSRRRLVCRRCEGLVLNTRQRFNSPTPSPQPASSRRFAAAETPRSSRVRWVASTHCLRTTQKFNRPSDRSARRRRRPDARDHCRRERLVAAMVDRRRRRTHARRRLAA